MPETARISQPKRILYFDWIEAVSIFLVISVHAVWLRDTVPASAVTALAVAAVPLFFMVHGALLLRRNAPAKKQIARFVRVVVQVVVWDTVYLLLSYCSGGMGDTKLTLGFLYRYYLNGDSSGAINHGHLWFIHALLFLYLCYPILCAVRDADPKLLAYVAAVAFVFSFGVCEVSVWGTVLGERFFGSALTLDTLARKLSVFGQYGNCLFYFVLGYLFADWAEKEPKAQPKWLGLSAALTAAGLAWMMLERQLAFGTLAYNWKTLPNNYSRLGGVLMAVGLFLLFAQIPFREGRIYDLVRTISVHTIDIFYLHMIFAYFAYAAFYQASRAGVLTNYLRGAVILLLSLGVGLVLRRIPVVKKLLE